MTHSSTCGSGDEGKPPTTLHVSRDGARREPRVMKTILSEERW
jgi:hypothetical protein